jgi:signal transduction histidine kinase
MRLPWVVVADDDRLMQVVINLLSNAVKFVPQGSGSVIVSATLSPSEISVGIADNGPGVPAQDVALIFEKFRQAGRRENAKPQGTGLGLPISREIIEHFEGRLWLDPSSKDGARFVFSLPLAPA